MGRCCNKNFKVSISEPTPQATKRLAATVAASREEQTVSNSALEALEALEEDKMNESS
jgi:hypothetical protein